MDFASTNAKRSGPRNATQKMAPSPPSARGSRGRAAAASRLTGPGPGPLQGGPEGPEKQGIFPKREAGAAAAPLGLPQSLPAACWSGGFPAPVNEAHAGCARGGHCSCGAEVKSGDVLWVSHGLPLAPFFGWPGCLRWETKSRWLSA